MPWPYCSMVFISPTPNQGKPMKHLEQIFPLFLIIVLHLLFFLIFSSALRNFERINSRKFSPDISTCLFTIFGQGTVLGGSTPPSPTQDGAFPQSSVSPRKVLRSFYEEKLTILTPSSPPCSLPLLFPVIFCFLRRLLTEIASLIVGDSNTTWGLRWVQTEGTSWKS